MRAREIMSEGVVTVPATATLREALAAMEQAGLSKLPVTDGLRVLGMLTARALQRAMRQGRSDWLDLPVADVAEPDLTFVDPDLPLSEVLVELRSAPALLVGVEHRLLGIITARDVVHLAAPWLLVMEVEHGLRRCIDQRLSRLSQRWWEELVPGHVARVWAHERFEGTERELPPGQRYLSHATWWQYEAIIEVNWGAAFAPVFRKREEALAHLSAVHEARNRLAHGLSLDEEQQAALEAGARYLLKRT